MPFGIQVKNTILYHFHSSRLKAAPTIHSMHFVNLVVCVSFAQAVPKFQRDCKKINLLSDRTRKSKLGEKWWRSEMVGAGSDLLAAKPSNFAMASHLAVVSTDIFLVSPNFGKRLFTPAIPARMRANAKNALQWSLSPNNNAPQKTPVIGSK